MNILLLIKDKPIVNQLPLIFYELDYELGRISTAFMIMCVLSDHDQFNKLHNNIRKKMVYELELYIFEKANSIYLLKNVCDKNKYSFHKIYTKISYETVTNISIYNTPINYELINNILTFKLSICDYVNTDYKYVNPKLNEHLIINKIQKMSVKPSEESSSGLFICIRCGCNDVVSSNLYNRSADEPVSKYLFCKNCQYNWNSNF